MILAGRLINENMSDYVSSYIVSALKNLKKTPKSAKVGIFGLTFKEDCPDLQTPKS